MGHRTPLYEEHRRAGAKMVDFGGWDMPLHYGSQLAEHHAVRRDAGLFDVSHMRTVEVRGDGARPFLRRLLANDVDKLKLPGKALYSCLLNEDGGVRDDLITYYLTDDWYRIVVNAGPAERDIAWFREAARGFRVDITPRPDLAMLAVQGPQAVNRARDVLGAAAATLARLQAFQGAVVADGFIARTGYTGEDGFEMIVDVAAAPRLWQRLQAAGIRPCGLGARDTLRLEAGMNLYGHDMDETVTPWESALGWTVALTPGRDFIGRAALERQQAAGVPRRLAGLVLEVPGVLRNDQIVQTPQGPGIMTSGSFSPTLERGIGLVRLPSAIPPGSRCEVVVRAGRVAPARVVAVPFVRQGRTLVNL